MKKQNCKNKKTNYKKTTGITLIALVVTIIVLLILAGISIMMLSGNGEILTRTEEAKKKCKKKEARLLLTMEVTTNVTETIFQGIEFAYTSGFRVALY